MGGLAGGADLILIPEITVTLDEIIDRLQKRLQSGHDFSIIVVAEGVQVAASPTSRRATARSMPSATPS